MEEQFIEISGAREHNLRNIDIKIPRNRLTVITGLSGSGKSSLAFNTIYAEGQRRYIETFSAYARQFLGELERPDVDKIEGLSPVISIEQKTTLKNPRSTVGTITEIYDFLRLLYAKIGIAYSYQTNRPMVSYTLEEIQGYILKEFDGKAIYILAPLVRARKGHYRELFLGLAKKGFLKVKIDGVIQQIKRGMKLDRYKIHDIELVIDQLIVSKKQSKRLSESIKTALFHGKNLLAIQEKGTQTERYFSKHLMCMETGISYPKPEPNTFSFNSPKGACTKCKGLGLVHQIDKKKITPNTKLSISQGGLAPLGSIKKNWIFNQIEMIAKKYNFSLLTPIYKIPDQAMSILLYGTSEKFSISSKTLGVEQKYSIDFEGLLPFIQNQYEQQASKSLHRWAKEFMNVIKCPECHGVRLKKEALHFLILDKSIGQLTQMYIDDLATWIRQLIDQLSDREQIIAKEIIKEISERLTFLSNVGLDYLTLNRSSKTLSGGESQRIRLATQIGSQLTNVLYILDEPSIGLHQKDNKKLIRSLKELRDLGNSLIVVEHDKEMIESSDFIIDIGPGAGKMGGEIVAKGDLEMILNMSTLTSKYLNGSLYIEIPKQRRKTNGKWIELKGAKGNNLKSVDLKIPLGVLVCVSGVSGSGKSTLINETLYRILNQKIYGALQDPLPYKEMIGHQEIDKIVDIDQSAIGRTPRSNPSTYTQVFSHIRALFSELPESKIRGYKPGRFSFNVTGGRCETCKGGGLQVIEMNLLPDVNVPCETCLGKRFNRETLEVRYKGKSISDVLNMSVETACNFFEPIPKIHRILKTLDQVGLGYIALGQSSTTLSGGEAQRVKLSSELSKKNTGQTLYILDEPTTGLHFEDIRLLVDLLQKLVDVGNTVLIIEHNMDVLKMADYLIDLGPEGGKNGGMIVAEGTPEEVSQIKKSYTGHYLKKELNCL